MTYCTQQDLIDRHSELKLAQLTDVVNKPASTVNVVTVAKHIGDAASTIDSYIAKRVSLPMATVPAVLTKVAVDLSWYFILGNRAQKDDQETAAYKEAIRWLENVSKGLVVIGGDDGAEVAPAGGGQVKTSKPNRVFTRDRLAGF